MAQTRQTSPAKEKTPARHEALGLTDQDILNSYRKMVLSRALDERVVMLNRQGKVPIVASAQGQEGAQMGSLLATLKDGDCFLFPYYRDLCLKMAAGLTALETMLSFMGKDGEIYSGARQFPLQGADLKHGIIQISNVVAAGLTQAVGYALGCKMLGQSTVVLSYFGDGGSSEGECHEAMNFAGIHKLPVVFICENNRYAISVPLKKQMAVENVADRAPSYGFPGFVVDGMDTLQVFESTRNAIEHARLLGPVLLDMRVERYMPHTSDDDDRRYRPMGEVEEARNRDPINLLRDYLAGTGLLTEDQEEEIRRETKIEVNQATDDAEAAPYPDPSTVYDHVYAPSGGDIGR